MFYNQDVCLYVKFAHIWFVWDTIDYTHSFVL